MEESLEIRLQQITISDFHFNYVAVKEAIEFKRANDPAFKHISMATIAKKLGLGESTYKKVLSGATADPQCSTLWAICNFYGLDPAVILGLAPKQNYAREAEGYDPSLMATMRRQLTASDERLFAKQQRIEEYERERKEIISQHEEDKRQYEATLNDLRAKHLEVSKELASAQSDLKAHREALMIRDASIAKHDEVRGSHIKIINDLVNRNKRLHLLTIVFGVLLCSAIIAIINMLVKGA